MCYVNFDGTKTQWFEPVERRAALAEIPSALMYREAERVEQDAVWRMGSLMAFTVSPWGGGYDCHRTWETLILGGIPIVKRPPVADVYDGLPVWIVDDWHAVSSVNMTRVQHRFVRHAWLMERLTLAYWMGLIRATAARG